MKHSLRKIRNRLTWVALLAVQLAASSQPMQRLEEGAGNRSVVIRMTDDMKFIPENPTIAVGDTVIWVNEGSLPHTTTDKPGMAAVAEHNVLPAGADPWDSGLLSKGEKYSQVFTVRGAYTYLCIFHEAAGMIGRLTVK